MLQAIYSLLQISITVAAISAKQHLLPPPRQPTLPGLSVVRKIHQTRRQDMPFSKSGTNWDQVYGPSEEAFYLGKMTSHT